MRRLTWIAIVALALALAGGGIAAAWLATSEGALVWLASRLTAATGGAVEVNGPRGNLAGTIRFSRLRYEDEKVRITAQAVALEPSLLAALVRRLELKTLSASEVEIVIKPSPGAPALPETLALPLSVEIGRATFDRVELRGIPDAATLEAVSFAYSGSAKEHAVRGIKVKSAFGLLEGTIAVGATRPFAASGTVSLASEDARLPFSIRASLGGNLEGLDLALGGEAAAAAVSGTLQLAPFAARPLAAASVRLSALDLARLDASWPRTQLALEAQAASREDGAIAGTIEAKNAMAGTLTDGQLPLTQLASQFAWRDGELTLTALDAGFGAGGRASGTLRVAAGRAALDLQVKRLDLRAFHRPLRETHLDGAIAAAIGSASQDVRARLAQAGLRFELEGTRRGDAFTVKRLVASAGGGTLTAAGTIGLAGKQAFDARATLARFDPAAFGNYPGARIDADITVTGELEPQWRADVQFEIRDSRWRASPLAGAGRLAVSQSAVRNADVTLRIGANRLVAKGALGRADDLLSIALTAPQLIELDPRLGGRATVNATLRGVLERPAVEFTANGERVEAPGGIRLAKLAARGALTADVDPRIDFELTATKAGAGRLALESASVKSSGSLARHVLELAAAGDGVDFASRLAGSWRGAGGWTGTLEQLSNRGRFPVQLVAPVAAEAGTGKFILGEAALMLGEGRVAIRHLRWERGRLSTRGEFAGVAVAPFLVLANVGPGVASTLLLRGAWSIESSPRLNGTLALARESGDVTVGDPAGGSSARMPLELNELRLDAKLVDDAASGAVVVAARRLGTVNATYEIGRAPGVAPGAFSPDAPLKAQVTAAIATLRPLGGLIEGQPAIDGKINASLAAGGTVRAPLITGRIEGSGLALAIPGNGVRLVDGSLTAELDAEALRVEKFEIRGGSGRLTASGVAPRSGDTALAWQAENLRLFGRPDRLLTVDGAGKLAVVNGQVVFQGALAAREGYFEFAGGRGAALGEDVVVIGRTPKPPPQAARGRSPLKATLELDFGRSFRIVGAGLDTGLTGKLRIDTRESGEFLGSGEIVAVRGLYFFLGQRLEIERGRLLFDGPLENPALDVLAVRRGLAVEPGVELTGTLRNPRLQVVSRPPLPEGDKLAWLVLGRGLDTATPSDAISLQMAAASLLDNANSIPLGRRIALSMGLDDIRVQGGSGSTQGTSVAFGTRLSERLYLTFEQGLTVARMLVQLEYLLGRGFRVRASGGQESSMGVFYTRSFD